MKKTWLMALLLTALSTTAVADDDDSAYAQALKNFKDQPATATFFDNSVAYALFPTIGKGGIGIGGAFGKGRVYRGGNYVGNVKMGQLTIGLQLGGQAYSQLILFKNKDTYDEFTEGNFEFGADATAVALTYGAQAGATTKGASASAGDTKGVGSWKRGMAVYTIAGGGLMYEASIGGQKFKYKPVK